MIRGDLKYWLKCKTVYFYQRGKRGYALNDTWSFDDYLCDVIIGGLKELRSRNIGCPSFFYENNNCDKWRIVLDKIIEGFEAKKRASDLDYPENIYESMQEDELKFKEAMCLLTEHFGHLWD
jgi:hypothetical protein